MSLVFEETTSETTNQESVQIVLVEDDPGHARLIQKGLKRVGITNTLVILRDGQEAIDFLFEPANVTVPMLILLDLNLPVLNGYQVLQRIKKASHLCHIPIIVLTTTDDLREVNKCYSLGCNMYITKPIEYASFIDALRKLGLFLSVVKVPMDAGGETDE